MTFNDFKFNSKLLMGIEYETPTEIQSQAIPLILEGHDLKASAQTGTGKTAAFILPLLHMLTTPSKKPGKGPRVLVLVPTRELAMQVAAETKKFSTHLPFIKTACIYGGVPYPMQNRQLSRHYDILIATPGRLIDQLDRGRIHLDRIEVMVLDEADRMLDMGFIEPVELIAEATPKERQTLMFSATLKGEVLRLSKKLLNNPKEIRINPEQTSQVNVEQRLHYVDNIEHKLNLLEQILNDPSINHAIVFTATKISADQLVAHLDDKGHQVAALHGDMNQRQRTRTISRLREGKNLKILVATDVASRGIDVQTISHVINFDLPRNVEDYVHRIGRTGRAGAKGIAFSFASRQDGLLVSRIEKFTNEKIVPHVIPGMEPKMQPLIMPKRARGRPSQAKRNFFPKFGKEEDKQSTSERSFKTATRRGGKPSYTKKIGFPSAGRKKVGSSNNFKPQYSQSR